MVGQTLKNKFVTCPKLGKRQKINLRFAHGWASLKEIIWALAPLEYTPRKKIGACSSLSKHQKVL